MMNSTMDNTHTDIERIVMRRVHLIRILKLVISTVVFATLTFIAALWGIGKEVWVAHVFENGPQDFFGHLQYLGYAFLHTHIIVQILTLLTLASLIFLARETIRLAFTLFTPSHS
jgi:FtsH-binding integral membrane protein